MWFSVYVSILKHSGKFATNSVSTGPQYGSTLLVMTFEPTMNDIGNFTKSENDAVQRDQRRISCTI